MAEDVVSFVTTCRVCGADDWQRVISFGEVPLANGFLEATEPAVREQGYPLELISCRRCRLLSLTVVVDPQVLYRTYSYVTSDSETMLHHMREVVRHCRQWIAPEGLVVELGSNTGQQLRAFQESGFQVLGVDPARNLASIAEDGGVPTVPEYFTARLARQVAAEHGRASLILGRHVFAHINDLTDVLDGVQALLDDDGLFTIEVPYAVDLVERVAFDTIYHEHLSYFLIGTLDTLFARHGMRIVDVQRLAVHGGSVLVTAGRAGRGWTATAQVGDLIAYEREHGYRTDQPYDTFAGRVRDTCTRLAQLVRREAAAGRRIAGYGASAKGTTLLNICGLGREVLEFCTDTTPQKQGRLTPGTHIPVVAPGDVREQPDLYLLLAWNYADEIIRKESAFLEAGGGFIIPVPEPRIHSAQEVAR